MIDAMPLSRLRTARSATTLLALATAVGLASCGESSEDEALAQVCDARSAIEQEVEELGNTTLATVSVDQVRGSLEAIQADLQQMADATGDLAEDTRAEVEAATEDFRSTVEATRSELGQTETLQEARAQVSTSIDALGNSYEEALAPIECD